MALLESPDLPSRVLSSDLDLLEKEGDREVEKMLLRQENFNLPVSLFSKNIDNQKFSPMIICHL